MKPKFYPYLTIILSLISIQAINAISMPKNITELCKSGVTQGLNTCASYKYKQAIQNQKDIYGKALSSAIADDKFYKQNGIHQNVSSKKSFIATQKKWESYQESYCHILANAYRGGR